MTRFLVGRLIQSVVTLLIISFVAFGLVRLTGNPLDMMLAADASPEMREQLSRAMGLEQPIPVQYGIFLRKLLQADLGTSIRNDVPVTELLWERFPNTLELAAVAMGLALLLALPLGVLAAVRRGSIWDNATRFVSLLGQSIPTFWAGILLITIFSVKLGWLPAGRHGGFLHLILPAVTLGLFGFMLSGVTRILRGAMIETLDSDYILFARIKGVGSSAVAWRHAFSNALIPVVTFIGFYFGIMVSGAVVVESVFAWPGVGRLAYEAVQWRDYPVVQGVVLLVSVVTLMTNLIVDILYAYLDPRIRFS